MVNKQLIADYLTRCGVNGFVFGGGRHGMSGPEITIENCSPNMSTKLQNACNDALICRGGGGMGGTYAYRQVSPELFSDPKVRAHAMLEAFELSGALSVPNEHDIWCDEKANLVGPSQEIIYPADERTWQLRKWINQNEHLWAQGEMDGANGALQARIANLPSLSKGAGPAYTLAVVALDAISKAGGDALAVDWAQVDKEAIAMCVLKHGQPAQSVRNVLEIHSPGTVTPEGLQAMRVGVARVEQAASHPSEGEIVRSGVSVAPSHP